MITPRQVFLMAAAISIFPGYAQSTSKLKDFTFTVQGTSSMHDWESKVTKVEWKGNATLDQNKVLTLQNVEVKIPVESIKSDKGKVMDGKTYDAFNSNKNPHIIFKVVRFTQQASGDNILVKVEGTLTMNGVTNPITLSVTGKSLPDGNVKFTGTQSLKMTEYKMKPPTAVMGTIKVGDQVTVKFDLTMSK